jgi:hypothetical protein
MHVIILYYFGVTNEDRAASLKDDAADNNSEAMTMPRANVLENQRDDPAGWRHSLAQPGRICRRVGKIFPQALAGLRRGTQHDVDRRNIVWVKQSAALLQGRRPMTICCWPSPRGISSLSGG